MKIRLPEGTVLRVHPLFLFLLLLYCIAGHGRMICSYLLALLLHESGHYCAALALRLPVSQIELTPFGGAMQIDSSSRLTGARGLLLSAAGVLVNLACLPPAFLAVFRGNGGLFFTYFLLANALMLAVNLLPVLPLDGGRMLLALIGKYIGPARAFRALQRLGRVLSLLLILWSVLAAFDGAFKPRGALTGCYLLYAASLEEKNGVTRCLAALISRRGRLDKGAALPVYPLCALGTLPLYRLLPQLRPGAYHVVLVLQDDGCTARGAVLEDDLLRAALEDPSQPLDRLLPSRHVN